MFAVYIYDPFGNPLTQLFDIFQLKITQKLNDYDTASFSISMQYNIPYLYLKEFNKLQIVKETDNKVMFEGVIKRVEADFDKYSISCYGHEYLLDRKLLPTAKIYTQTSIADILNDIFVGYSIDTDANKLVDIEFDANVSLLTVLKDLANFGYDFKATSNQIVFKTLIGVDRTTNPNYFEFFANSKWTNIAQYKFSYDADNLANKIITDSGVFEDADSQAIFGVIEKYEMEGDEALLEELKYGVKEIELTPVNVDFFDVNVGDLVAVNIDVDRQLLDFKGSLKVVEKSFEANEMETTQIKLAKGKYYTPTLIEKIKQMDETLQRLIVK